MAEAFTDVYENYKKYENSMRTAAYVTAVKKIVDAMQALGRIQTPFFSAFLTHFLQKTMTCMQTVSVY